MARRDLLKGAVALAGVGAVQVGGRALAATDFRIVETACGKLRGSVSGGLALFKGVPYAAPPLGRNRFLPPQPITPWAGIREALELGHQCPQINPDFPVWLDPTVPSEDCLVLNIWAPERAQATSKLPVMVWIHGGAFVYGSAGASFYDCGDIARNADVITVGINHRLNVFGYSYLGENVDERFGESGNAGQLDLVAALKWIQENIAAFGGDPGNVTIFGESGGGAKVGTLLAMGEAKGLFHKAIVQSGSLLRFQQAADAAAVTGRLFRELGLREGDVEALQTVPASALVAYMKHFMEPIFSDGVMSLLQYGPVIDGKVLKSQAWIDGVPELARSIPTIIGSNLHESIGFLGAEPGALDASIPDDRAFAERIARYSIINKVSVEEIVPLVSRYRRVMPSLSDRELLVRVTTDVGFWNNAVKQCTAIASHGGAPVYAYECSWKTPCFGGMWAPHGIELPFIFHRQTYGTAWDGKDTNAARVKADPDGHRFVVGAKMFEAWMGFVKTGNPSTDSLNWPAYDTTSRPTMVFDTHTRVVNDNRGEVRPQVTALTAR